MAILMLKTVSADGTAYDGFRWPLEVGAVVTAPDWDPKPECGHGLHGLPWGEGKASLLAIVGDCGYANARENSIAVGGKFATVMVGNNGIAIAGYGGDVAVRERGIAVVGEDGRASAGPDGIICIAWMDGERRRLAVGYIGEDDGLLPNTVYRFDATTKRFIPVMTETSEAMTP